MPEILVLVTTVGVFVTQATLLSYSLGWQKHGVVILQQVQGGLLAPGMPPITPSSVSALLLPAILIAVIGFVESIVVAKTYAALNAYTISPNRELVALGVSNVLGSLCHSYPVFGSLSRSAVASGSKTQGAGAIVGVLVLLSTLFFMPLLYYTPRAVCACIMYAILTQCDCRLWAC